MVGPGRTYKPVQGGFLVLRPDMKVYEEFVRVIKKGIDKEGTGWGGLVGPFYGFMTFQGNCKIETVPKFRIRPIPHAHLQNSKV